MPGSKGPLERARPSLDPRRVAACLKACEGVPTEKLEDGVILRLVAACIHVDDPEIRAILEELSPLRPRLLKKPPAAGK